MACFILEKIFWYPLPLNKYSIQPLFLSLLVVWEICFELGNTKFSIISFFLKSNPGNFEDLSSSLNPNSLQIKNGFVESNLSNAKIEMAYQFEREGYFCRDSESENKLVFNKTVGLRDSYK